MKRMSPEDMAKWEKARRQGFRRFLWTRGFLGWGIPVGVLWWSAMALFAPTQNPGRLLVLALLIFPIGGLAWAAWLWRIGEKRYAASRNPGTSP